MFIIVKVSTNKNRVIVCTTCNCPRGLDVYHHVVALLTVSYQCMQVISIFCIIVIVRVPRLKLCNEGKAIWASYQVIRQFRRAKLDTLLIAEELKADFNKKCLCFAGQQLFKTSLPDFVLLKF